MVYGIYSTYFIITNLKVKICLKYIWPDVLFQQPLPYTDIVKLSVILTAVLEKQ